MEFYHHHVGCDALHNNEKSDQNKPKQFNNQHWGRREIIVKKNSNQGRQLVIAV